MCTLRASTFLLDPLTFLRGIMRVSLEIPDDLCRRVKEISGGRPLSEIVRNLLAQYIASNGSKEKNRLEL